MTFAAGARLGPYEILAPLGAGGMGEVYRARDTRLKRDVALKVLTGSSVEDSGRFRRFQTEAESTAALSHPSIVAVYDVGQENGTPYIVSELVAGGTLTSLLARGPLPPRKLLDLAIPVAEGLAAAHARGIVHRDLKPDNILLTADGAPKIADFGLAKYFLPSQDAEGSQLTTLTDDRTKEGTIVGTISYMSPEQAKGEAVDYRSDQFSFGLLLYEMATGQRAFRKATAVQTLAAIVQEEPEPIGKLNPILPPPLRWIIERCLAKEPKQRYASTEDLARELATVREHVAEVSGSDFFQSPRLSPDGRKVAVLTEDPTRNASEIWIYDAATGARSRFAPGPVHHGNPVWSPAGDRILFASERKSGGGSALLVKPIDGSGEERLLEAPDGNDPEDWSSDGRLVSFVSVRAQGKRNFQLWTLSLTGERKVAPLATEAPSQGTSHFSPDGHWIAYSSNESGPFEVYVSSVGDPGRRWQVSRGGGWDSRWRRDGRELYYVSLENKVMAVPVRLDSTFQAGSPAALFSVPSTAVWPSAYDVSGDGQRFLVNSPSHEENSTPLSLLADWTALLKS